jgi:hypothetical protein
MAQARAQAQHVRLHVEGGGFSEIEPDRGVRGLVLAVAGDEPVL